MARGDYFVVPARKTMTDTGHLVSSEPARLCANGTEKEWEFASTAQAKDEAEFSFGVTGWDTDDRGWLFSR